MANKTFNTRVKNKRDTAANWEAVATTFQPLDGELIIVDTSAGKTRFKVGRYDTAKGRLLYYNEIPFADEYLYNDLNESQGKIYDKLKGIDDKSIIEMTFEPSTGTAAVKQYNIGIWQFPKTGFYKIKLSQLGTNITFLRLYARKTKDDGTLPEDDFSNDNLVLTSGAGGDGQLEYIYILADYLDIDSLTAYKIQFLNPILKQGITWVNTYDKTTQKWSFASAANVNAKNVSSNLTLTKGDTKTVYDGSVAREILIPTKTSELTNDSNFTTQTDLDNLTNTVVSYNAQENITDEQKATARANIGAISSSELVQSDWNQNDTTAKDYVKNRICYEEETVTELGNTYAVWNELTTADRYTPISYKMNGTIYKDVVPTYSSTAGVYMYNGVAPYDHYIGVSTQNSSIDSGGVNFQFVKVEDTVKQIDPKFIPNDSPLIVTITETTTNGNTTYSADHTFAEIQTAISEEQSVYLTIANSNTYLPVSNFDNTNVLFSFVSAIGTASPPNVISRVFIITNDNKVISFQDTVGGVPPVTNTDSEQYLKTRGKTYIWETLPPQIFLVKFTFSEHGPTLDTTAKIIYDAYAANNVVIATGNNSQYLLVKATKSSDKYSICFSALEYANAFTQTCITIFYAKDVEKSFMGAYSYYYKYDFEAQPDWNQNNTTASDYIKNRPGGYYSVVNSVDSGTLTTTDFADLSSEGSGITGYIVPNETFNTALQNLNVTAGKTYKISWVDNGQAFSYISEAVDLVKTEGSVTYHNICIFGDTIVNLTAAELIWGKTAKVIFLSNSVATATNTVTNVKVEEVNVVKIPKALVESDSIEEFDLSNNYTATNKGSIKYIKTDRQDSTTHYALLGFENEGNLYPKLKVSGQELDTSYVNTTEYSSGSIKSSWVDHSETGDTFIHGIDINHDRYNKALILQSELLDNTTEDLSVRGIATPTADNDAVNKKYVDDVKNDVATNYVKFTAEQTLTNEQKAQARDNINAPSAADAVYTATAASTDGVAYTATVSGIDSLTVGASFIMIPNKASASKAPTLNVNGLGAKPIRRRLSSLTTSLQQGYSTNWIALNKPFTVVYDGTAWVIEGLTKTDGADVYGAVAQATADAKGNNIADTYATIAMLQSLLPKVTTITLTSNWVGDASPYYQDIALSCVTETSIVDLQPTPEQLNSWQDDGIAFTTLSGNGTVRVYVAGGKPSSAISVQVRVQEVTVI